MIELTNGIPPAVQRRLQLALAGWRFADGCWTKGPNMMTEELVDALPEGAWVAAIGRWPASVVSAN
jgi:hypothetical protein